MTFFNDGYSEGFVFKDDYMVQLAKLSDEEIGTLVMAFCTYHINGEMPELNDRLALVADILLPDVEWIN